jgi:hypothetical protein
MRIQSQPRTESLVLPSLVALDRFTVARSGCPSPRSTRLASRAVPLTGVLAGLLPLHENLVRFVGRAPTAPRIHSIRCEICAHMALSS